MKALPTRASPQPAVGERSGAPADAGGRAAGVGAVGHAVRAVGAGLHENVAAVGVERCPRHQAGHALVAGEIDIRYTDADIEVARHLAIDEAELVAGVPDVGTAGGDVVVGAFGDSLGRAAGRAADISAGKAERGRGRDGGFIAVARVGGRAERANAVAVGRAGRDAGVGVGGRVGVQDRDRRPIASACFPLDLEVQLVRTRIVPDELDAASDTAGDEAVRCGRHAGGDGDGQLGRRQRVARGVRGGDAVDVLRVDRNAGVEVTRDVRAERGDGRPDR